MLALVMLMTLLPPVDGRVVRGFAGGEDPFVRGLRRTVVLSAAAGTPVRAPCTGVVGFAGVTPRGPALTLRCGRGRRVAVSAVRATVVRGARVRRGTPLGQATGDVHLSVRERGGSYVAPRLARGGHAPPAPAPVRRRAPRHGPPRPPAPRPVLTPRSAPMPWPAWAGAALLLTAGAAGLRVRGRAARAVRRRSLSRQPWTSG